MAVFKRIATIRVQDPNKPMREVEIFQQQAEFRGIDVIPLQVAGGLKEATLKFICSDNSPTSPRTAEDIDRLLSRLHVVRESKTHPRDPDNFATHSLSIQANLDDPNLDDRFLKKGQAKDIHEEQLSKEQVKQINEDLERQGKKKLDERKTRFKVGEVERG
jgi:hypothetical protein